MKVSLPSYKCFAPLIFYAFFANGAMAAVPQACLTPSEDISRASQSLQDEGWAQIAREDLYPELLDALSITYLSRYHYGDALTVDVAQSIARAQKSAEAAAKRKPLPGLETRVFHHIQGAAFDVLLLNWTRRAGIIEVTCKIALSGAGHDGTTLFKMMPAQAGAPLEHASIDRMSVWSRKIKEYFNNSLDIGEVIETWARQKHPRT